MFRKILAASNAQSLPKLRHALSAGEKMPDALQQAWTTTTGAPVYEAYGMSECSTFISASPSHPARPGCVGRPQTGRRVAIVNTDRPVAIGTQGMIAVSRDDQGLMLGYRNAPLTLKVSCGLAIGLSLQTKELWPKMVRLPIVVGPMIS